VDQEGNITLYEDASAGLPGNAAFDANDADPAGSLALTNRKEEPS